MSLPEWYNPLSSWEFLKFWKTVWPELNENLSYWERRAANGESPRIFPIRENWFKALELTSHESVKCVILGQDPYPTRGHANGLAFSVYPHVRPIPKNLQNIFKEYESDLGYSYPSTGDLSGWAQGGVLLLNSILTVEEGKPLSHAGLGWEKLCFEICRVLGERGDVVGILWGHKAAEYASTFPREMLVQSSHPSPLSNTKGTTPFTGSKPFSRCNEILRSKGLKEIDWKLR